MVGVHLKELFPELDTVLWAQSLTQTGVEFVFWNLCFFSSFFLARACGSPPAINSAPTLHWSPGVLTSGPPGKSPYASSMQPVLISLDCYNKVPQTGDL